MGETLIQRRRVGEEGLRVVKPLSVGTKALDLTRREDDLTYKRSAG